MARRAESTAHIMATAMAKAAKRDPKDMLILEILTMMRRIRYKKECLAIIKSIEAYVKNDIYWIRG